MLSFMDRKQLVLEINHLTAGIEAARQRGLNQDVALMIEHRRRAASRLLGDDDAHLEYARRNGAIQMGLFEKARRQGNLRAAALCWRALDRACRLSCGWLDRIGGRKLLPEKYA